MAQSSFDFSRFINESKEILLNPKDGFAHLPKEGGYVEPIIKAVLYGLVAGIISFLYSIAGMTTMGMMGGGRHGMGGILGGAVGVGALIITPIMAVVGLFIGGVVLLIISAIGGGSTNYEHNVRATAASMVIYPVSALLGIASFLNLYAGLLVGILVSLYGLWMLFNALVHYLSAKEGTSKIIVGILALIVVFTSISGFFAARKAAGLLEEMGKDMHSMEQMHGTESGAENGGAMMEEMKNMQQPKTPEEAKRMAEQIMKKYGQKTPSGQ